MGMQTSLEDDLSILFGFGCFSEVSGNGKDFEARSITMSCIVMLKSFDSMLNIGVEQEKPRLDSFTKFEEDGGFDWFDICRRSWSSLLNVFDKIRFACRVFLYICLLSPNNGSVLLSSSVCTPLS